MGDSLRDRIAAVLWSTGWSVHNHGTEQGDGLACRERLVDGNLRGDCYWKQADAVIAELGLRREGSKPRTVTNDQGATYRIEGGHRYVTEWKADDE